MAKEISHTRDAFEETKEESMYIDPYHTFRVVQFCRSL